MQAEHHRPDPVLLRGQHRDHEYPLFVAGDGAHDAGHGGSHAVGGHPATGGAGVHPLPFDFGQVGTGSGTVSAIPLTGVGTPTTLITGQPSPAGVVVDASHIYWADSGSGTVSERSLAGGITISLYVSNQFTAPAGVAVDSGHVYWANSGTGTINEVPLTDGTVTTLFSGQAQPWGWRWTASVPHGHSSCRHARKQLRYAHE